MAEQVMFHYTDEAGFKAISSQIAWTFLAGQPPGGRPIGAYFTTKNPQFPRLFKLAIPRWKRAYVFAFADVSDLKGLSGGRGEYVFYSPTDYTVDVTRQRFCGRVELWKSAEPT